MCLPNDNLKTEVTNLSTITPYLGLLKLKLIKFRSKWDLFSAVLQPILNGWKMRFRPANSAVAVKTMYQ